MALLIPFLLIASAQTPAKPPEVGKKAPDFNVKTLAKKEVKLAPMLKKGKLVLIVLRGYPGYQCPFCTKQVAELMEHSDDFKKRKASVVLVYPGPSDQLEKYAGDFIAGKDIPKDFRFTIDPGYDFTNRYALRWDAPHETAYPSTFVIGRDGVVIYAKVSHSHGDRAPLADVLAALDK